MPFALRVVAIYIVGDMVLDLADGGDARAMCNHVRRACRARRVAI